MSKRDDRRLVCIVAGVGGHEAQAQILKELLIRTASNIDVKLILEDAGSRVKADCCITATSHLGKHGSQVSLIRFLPYFFINVFELVLKFRKLKRSYSKVSIISLGPFPAIPAYVASKILSCRFVSIESRSRFTTLSATNRLLHRIGAIVLSQHMNDEVRVRKINAIGVLLE